MSKNGYHYGSFNTNSRDNTLFIDFSTGHNGRGDWFEFDIYPNSTTLRYRNKDGKITETTGLSDSEFLKLIEKNISTRDD
jgi:hypothetical protein